MAPQTLLALDTSTLVASVALVVRDERGVRVAASSESDVKNHSDQLITMIDGVLGDAGAGLGDVDGIAVGAGPGSFTGLRIGMSTAKGLCFAAGVPLFAVSSLAALARDARERDARERDARGAVAAVLDARRGEVFVAVFDVREPVPLALVTDLVAKPADAAVRIAEATSQRPGLRPRLVGDGAALYARELAEVGDLDTSCRQTPSAASVGALAAAPVASLAAAVPTYLRPSEAERKYPHGNPGGVFARRDSAPD